MNQQRKETFNERAKNKSIQEQMQGVDGNVYIETEEQMHW